MQRDICTETISEEAESEEETEPVVECTRYEVNHILRFKLIEDTQSRVWIQGWLIDGEAHRSWLALVIKKAVFCLPAWLRKKILLLGVPTKRFKP